MKKIFTLILFLCMAVLMTLPASAAKKAKPRTIAKANAAYESYVAEKGIKKAEYVDIDGNGINELLAMFPDYKYGVCTYNIGKKKVVCLKRVSIGKYFTCPIYVDTKNSQFTLTRSSTAGTVYTTWKLSGSKVTRVTQISSLRNGGAGSPYISRENGKIISGVAFDNKVNAIRQLTTYDLYC